MASTTEPSEAVPSTTMGDDEGAEAGAATSTVGPTPEGSTTTVAPRLGTVTLSGVGLTVDATTDEEVLVGFGDDAATVLEHVSGALGEPIGDSGWGPDGACTAAEVRRLGWGGLEIVLAREAAKRFSLK